jgi:hypothetical protein
MHVTAVINAIKKRGHLDDYKKAANAYKKDKKAIESARAGLALLEETGENVQKASKKKTKEGKKEALQRLQIRRLRQRVQNKSQTLRKPRSLLL